MDAMLEKLKEYGVDVDRTMGRFLDDLDLYQTCFTVFLKDEAFSKLGEALQAKDYEKAFDHAHTLKGVAGNMGIAPMYDVLCNMVEDMRNHKYSNLQDCYARVMDELDRLEKL